MEFRQVKLIYFSPTGTTQKVLESIARGITVKDVEHVNLTVPGGAQQTISAVLDELVIIGSPVYGGRLPVEAVNRLKRLKAKETPAVCTVVYGNREFEDALLELKDLSIDLGFNPVAAAAFIGEHSFATEDVPIASGRPDESDIVKAMEFGAKIEDKVRAMRSPDAPVDLEVPGRFPYEGGARSMAVSPVSKAVICKVCGTCAGVCPTAAISISGNATTRIELCIRCCACIKNCPNGARVWEDSTMKSIANWLNENCSIRKEPQVFGVDV